MFRSVVWGAGAFICLVSMLPQELNARGGGSQSGHSVTVSKSTDKSSPKMMRQTNSSKTNPHPTQTSKKTKSIEVQDYGFGVSMPVSSSRSDGGGPTVGK
jgi:type VI protein secretion system component Hcp